MGLLEKLKSVLGLGGRHGPAAGTERNAGQEPGVTVEREPSTETEAAVKGTDQGPPGTESDDSVGTTPSADEGRSEAGDAATESADAGAADDGAEATAAGTGTDTGDAERGDVPVDELDGIGTAYADRLGDAGIETVADLADADVAAVAEDSGISETRIQGWVDQAENY